MRGPAHDAKVHRFLRHPAFSACTAGNVALTTRKFAENIEQNHF
jgi:hypothetical protein